MTTINDIWMTYDEGEGQWTGCNWPTRFGCLGLDLNGKLSGTAHQTATHWCAIAVDEAAHGGITSREEDSLVEMAEHLRLRRVVAYVGEAQECHAEVGGKSARLFCAATLAAEWEFAAQWLEEIELDAAWTEEQAQEAVAAAEQGEWDAALRHAGQACRIESGYNDCRLWTRLREVIEKATN